MYTGQLHQSLSELLLGGESLGLLFGYTDLIIIETYMFTMWWEIRVSMVELSLNGFRCISSCLCTCKKTTIFGRLVRFLLKFVFWLLFFVSLKRHSIVKYLHSCSLKKDLLSYPFFLFQSIKILRCTKLFFF